MHILYLLISADDSVIQHLDHDQDDSSSRVTRSSLSFQVEEGVSSVEVDPVEEHSKELPQLHKQLEEVCCISLYPGVFKFLRSME